MSEISTTNTSYLLEQTRYGTPIVPVDKHVEYALSKGITSSRMVFPKDGEPTRLASWEAYKIEDATILEALHQRLKILDHVLMPTPTPAHRLFSLEETRTMLAFTPGGYHPTTRSTLWEEEKTTFLNVSLQVKYGVPEIIAFCECWQLTSRPSPLSLSPGS